MENYVDPMQHMYLTQLSQAGCVTLLSQSTVQYPHIMVQITLDLLKRRAEHNEGQLSTVQELTLHQFDIESIPPLLHSTCRQLQILFLQSNQISCIENLYKLKSLEYLNLALNNIQWIQGLAGCESLQKLDLTVNFIQDLRCIQSLQVNMQLRELFLTGNPCTAVEGYRLYVIHTLPQLKALDGQVITKSERIEAAQQYERIKKVVESMPKYEMDKMESTVDVGEADREEQEQVLNQPKEQKDDSEQEELLPHTPAARLKVARDMAQRRAKNTTDPTERFKPTPPPPVPVPTFHPETGRIMQRNDAQLPFRLYDTDPRVLRLEVDVSPFVETGSIRVEVMGTWVRMEVRGKPLYLALPAEVRVEGSEVVRSVRTGQVVITMPRVQLEKTVLGGEKENGMESVDGSTEAGKKGPTSFTGYVVGQHKNTSLSDESFQRQKATHPVDYKNIVRHSMEEAEERARERVQRIRMARVVPPVAALGVDAEFVDDPECPPLL